MKRTFRWDSVKGELVEVSTRRQLSDLHYVQGDYERFVSPQDGTVVDGRKAYREHLKRHNLIPYEAMKGHHDVAEKRRREIQTGRIDKQERIAALSDAFEHERNQRRARFGR